MWLRVLPWRRSKTASWSCGGLRCDGSALLIALAIVKDEDVDGIQTGSKKVIASEIHSEMMLGRGLSR